MFKKLRDKITEEVQQTSLKLPVSVQQLSQLSPFTGSGDASEPSRSPQNSLQDELLVDISDIQPAGDNKDLFSIDEDSGEGTPSKSSEFQIIELTDDVNSSSSTPQKKASNQLANHSPFDPSTPLMTIPSSLISPRGRRYSESSNVSEVSGLFPIYEVPDVSFNTHMQSDLESCGSEWEDSSGGLDRLSKDTLYQAYLRMRQRYHKYKGRYSDIARAFEEKEKESDKLRDVLAKQQDKAVRRVSELREQCSLEQQAKAHLEEELRSDLEEKDHKIEALLTKVRLLQEGYLNEASFHSPFCPAVEIEKSPEEDERRTNSLPSLHPAVEVHHVGTSPADESDNVSVGSLGSISTAPNSLDSEELIERLKGDIIKYKTLLGRCMDNIKVNKDNIIRFKQENELLNCQLQEKNKNIDSLKLDHEKELDSLRASVESSSLSMAETKQQFFEELQTKEAEVEHIRKRAEELESVIKGQQEQIEELKNQSEDELEIDLDRQQQEVKEEETDILELEKKCSELENLVADLQKSKKNLELQIEILKNDSSRPQEDSTNDGEMPFYDLKDKHDQMEVELTQYKEKLNAVVIENKKLNNKIDCLSKESERLNSEKQELSEKLRIALELKNQINLEKAKISQELASLTKEKEAWEGNKEKLNTQANEALNKLKEAFNQEKTTNESLVKLVEEAKANGDNLLKDKEEIEGNYIHKLEEKEKLQEVLEISIKEMEFKLKNSENIYCETKSALKINCDRLAFLETTNIELNNKLYELEIILKEKHLQLEDLNNKYENRGIEIKDLFSQLDEFREMFITHLDLPNSLFTFDLACEKLQALITDKNSMQTRVEEYSQTCTNLEESLVTANFEINSLKNKESELQAKLLESESCLSISNLKVTDYEREALKFESQLSELNTKLSLSENGLSESASNLKEYEFKVSESATKLADYESELSISCTKLMNSESKLLESVAKLGEYESELSESRIKLSSYEKQILEYTQKLSDLEFKLSESTTKLLNCERNLSESTTRLTDCEIIMQCKDAELKNITDECNNLKAKNEAIVNDFSCQIKALEEKEPLKDNDSLSKVGESMRELGLVREQLAEKDQEIETLLKQIVDNKNNFEISLQTFQSQVQVLENLKMEYEEKEKQRDLKESQIDNYVTELEQLNNRIEEKVIEISSLESKLLEKDCLIETQSNELETLTLQHEKAINEFSKNMESSKECAINITKEMEHEVEIIADKLKNKENELDNLHSQLSRSTSENKKLELLLESKLKELDELNADFDKLTNDNKTLVTNINSLENGNAIKDQILIEMKNNENILKESLSKFERKIFSMIEEKKFILKDFETQTTEYESSLEEKDQKYKDALIDYEKQLEEKTSEYNEEREKIKSFLEKLSREKEVIQDQLIQFDTINSQKESLEKMLEESEKMRSQLEIEHVKRCREIEEEWQSKLRCELERIQSEHDRKLAEVANEAQLTQSIQLPEEVESLRRSLERKNSELAQLQGTCDTLEVEMENLKEELKSNLEGESSKEKLELRNEQLEKEVKLLQGKLMETENQMQKQVLSMENSNSDLRQKIDTLQNELSTLESQLKDKTSSWEARLLQEKAVVEERLKKENFETEKRLKNEIQEIKERLTNERRATEERLIKEKETVEQNFIEQKEILEDRLKNFENDYRSKIAEKEKSYSNLCSKFDSVQTEMDSLKNVCEQKTQEWQDLEQDMNLLLQAGGVPNQENSRILRVSTTGVQLKIKTLYQIKNEAIKELSSLKENYRTLVDKSLENKQKVAEYSSKIQSLEERISTIKNDNTALSNQIQSVKDSELHLKTLVASLESQLVEEKEKVSKYEVSFSEIYQVVTAIPHLPPKDSDDIKSTLLFLSSERENLKKQLLEEITNNEELSKELKDFKESLTENETENKYLLSKLGDTEKQLRLLQEEIQAKLSTAKTSETQTVHNLITEEGVEESINQCKAELHKEYEANLSEIKTIYENRNLEIEKAWKEKMAEMLKRREREMQQSLDQLTEQWNKEKAEVERLTQVASAAFKNGTDSMDLLKKQVITLRKELDDMKRNHKKEIGELQALLEIKKRRSRGDHGEVKLGASLEDAAEFEYLKYILYQYMMGKETQTLSKVLCEVVKFSKEQQKEVVEYEENKQSLLRNEEILSSQADKSEQKQSES